MNITSYYCYYFNRNYLRLHFISLCLSVIQSFSCQSESLKGQLDSESKTLIIFMTTHGGIR